jgi:hypothetical protein
MELRPAQRSNVKMRVALHGPSGSGKTYSALQLAFGISQNQVIAVIDTENGSAELYSHLGSFHVLPLSAPFTPEKFMEAIVTCNLFGADVLVIDSLSHAWEGSGGILEIHGNMPGNSFANWSKVVPRHNQLMQMLLHAPLHVIATLRAKQDYVMSDRNGKMIPEKIGLKPVQKEGIDYEFTLAFELSMDHKARASKDRTGMFVDKEPFRINKAVGRHIAQWCTQQVTQPAVNVEMNQNHNLNGTHY